MTGFSPDLWTVGDLGRTRLHESSHAVACSLLGIRVLELRAEADGGGECRHDPAPDPRSALLVLVAGSEGTSLAMGDLSYPRSRQASGDEEKAEALARRLARLDGSMWGDLLASARWSVRRMIEEHAASVEALARSLERNDDHLDHDDLYAALAAARLGKVWTRPARLRDIARSSPPHAVGGRLGSLGGRDTARPADAPVRPGSLRPGLTDLEISAALLKLGTRNVWRARWAEISARLAR